MDLKCETKQWWEFIDQQKETEESYKHLLNFLPLFVCHRVSFTSESEQKKGANSEKQPTVKKGSKRREEVDDEDDVALH